MLPSMHGTRVCAVHRTSVLYGTRPQLGVTTLLCTGLLVVMVIYPVRTVHEAIPKRILLRYYGNFPFQRRTDRGDPSPLFMR